MSDSKSRILGFKLSTAKSSTSPKKSSPTRARRLQAGSNEDTHATVLVDGSNVQEITAMDSHPNRSYDFYCILFRFLFYNTLK